MTATPDVIRGMAARGFSFREISGALDISIGRVCRSLRRDNVPVSDERRVVRDVTLNGGCSTSCATMRVSIPRVTFIDGVAA